MLIVISTCSVEGTSLCSWWVRVHATQLTAQFVSSLTALPESPKLEGDGDLNCCFDPAQCRGTFAGKLLLPRTHTI